MSHSDLIQACVRSDPNAWREFYFRYNQIISLTALRTAHRWDSKATDVVRDLIQDTYTKLCDQDYKILRNFELRGENSFYGFLKVITANVVHDYYRQIKKRRGEVPLEDEVYALSHPGMTGSQHDIQMRISIREIEEVLEEEAGPDAERDKTIFWLHHRQSFTAEEIATLFDFSLGVKGVESALHRVKKKIQHRLMEKKCACATSADPEKGI